MPRDCADDGPLAPIDHLARREAARSLLAAQGVGALVVPVGADLTYLTGLSLKKSERPMLLVIAADGGSHFVCPAFERERLRHVLGEVENVVYREEDDPYDEIARLLSGARSVMLSERAWYGESRAIASALPDAEVMPADAIIGRLRRTKDAGEIERIRRAIGWWEAVRSDVLGRVWDSGANTAIEAEVRRALLDCGGTEPSCSVSIGAGTALPHGDGRKTLLAENDVLLIDGGVAYEAYRSDLTRTYVFGTPEAHVRCVLEVVLEAQEAAIAAIRPGVRAETIDRAARDVIASAGYADSFVHRVGHGLGLEGHEPPYLVEGNQELLEAGMVLTIEPGIYLQGKFGVRIEDVVMVTETGVTSLSQRMRSIDDVLIDATLPTIRTEGS